MSVIGTALEAELIFVAEALADAARAETLRYFRTSELVADNKLAAGFDPVTEADRAAERHDALQQHGQRF